MRIKFVRTLWGIEEASDSKKWDDLFHEFALDGYQAIEVVSLGWRADTPLLEALLSKHKLGLVCQIHTCGGYLDNYGNYVYCSSSNVEHHKESFSALVNECSQIIKRNKQGGFINSHSGCDSWNTQQAIDFLSFALEEEKYIDIVVTHETHRQRLFFNPFSTMDILNCTAMKNLKINADLSHWVVACERVFDGNSERDKDWWPRCLEVVALHCTFIHCRIGWAEGPQISDSTAPEFSSEIAAHLFWWRQIWRAQQVRGMEASYCEPEFGPPPYMPVLPHSQNPVAVLANVVADVKKKVTKAFDEEFGSC
jgi:sugar phosphate isomerase/epimerase